MGKKRNKQTKQNKNPIDVFIAETKMTMICEVNAQCTEKDRQSSPERYTKLPAESIITKCAH